MPKRQYFHRERSCQISEKVSQKYENEHKISNFGNVIAFHLKWKSVIDWFKNSGLTFLGCIRYIQVHVCMFGMKVLQKVICILVTDTSTDNAPIVLVSWHCCRMDRTSHSSLSWRSYNGMLYIPQTPKLPSPSVSASVIQWMLLSINLSKQCQSCFTNFHVVCSLLKSYC